MNTQYKTHSLMKKKLVTKSKMKKSVSYYFSSVMKRKCWVVKYTKKLLNVFFYLLTKRCLKDYTNITHKNQCSITHIETTIPDTVSNHSDLKHEIFNNLPLLLHLLSNVLLIHTSNTNNQIHYFSKIFLLKQTNTKY